MVIKHSPALIVQQALINLGVGTDPTLNGQWPIFSSNEPESPDNCITIYDTTGIKDGRTMIDGGVLVHYGIQVRIRSNDYLNGYDKGQSIANLIDSVYWVQVTLGTSQYLIQDVSRQGGVQSIGRMTPTNKRSVFTINCLTTIDPINS